MTADSGDTLTLLLGGDVMLGRGIDQVLAHPGDPMLWEPGVRDARTYVRIAEEASGPVPAPVPDTWPWGDALAALTDPGVAARILNLETTVTRSDDVAPGKVVHYRMSPDNLGCLLAARPDVCVLANNHVLDFGRSGLAETLAELEVAGVATAGAGADLDAALAPAYVPVPDGPPVAVLAYGHASSGVPDDWAATGERSGVAVLRDLSRATAARVAERVAEEKRRGSVVVVSVHWGSNWGMAVPRDQVRFAHQIVEAGADVVHGHSSHHPRPLGVHQGRLVVHGCGDLVNDYEGIDAHASLRGDLRLLLRVTLRPDGVLVGADLLPFQSRRLRLEPAEPVDVAWLETLLDRPSRALGTAVHRASPGWLALDWS